MSDPQALHAEREILARELYVANQVSYNPDVPAREWRGDWYLKLTDDNRTAWRTQAVHVLESLSVSGLQLVRVKVIAAALGVTTDG